MGSGLLNTTKCDVMGCYDTVIVPCPKCGAHVQCQSKSGPCLLDEYPLSQCPPDVLADVNRHAPHRCWVCQHEFTVEIPESAFKPKPTYGEGQHLLICDALQVSPDPNSPGLSAYEAVCLLMHKIDLALDADDLEAAQRVLRRDRSTFPIIPCYGTVPSKDSQ